MPPFIRPLIQRHWSALTFQLNPHDTPLAIWMQACLAMGHIVGWLAIVQLSHNALGWSILPLLMIMPAFIYFKTRTLNAWLETLAPLFLVYGILAIRICLAILARLQDQEFVLEPPLANLLNIDSWVLISMVWVGASQVGILAQILERPLNFAKSVRLLSLIITVGTVLWAGQAYLDIRARGITASDPYAYVQMGHDFATTGSLAHEFDLVSLTESAHLNPYALVPIGYLEPDSETHIAATVWSPGYSVFLAIAYLIVGEIGFYILTPLMGVASLLALLWLVYMLLSDWEVPYRALAGAVSIFILATSLLQVVWVALPMADIPAQLFSTLAIVFIFRLKNSPSTAKNEWERGLRGLGGEGRFLFNGLLAGLCLGLAFAIRYTQVLMGVPMLYGLFWIFILEQRDWRKGLKAMLAVGIGAWLIAGLVFWYHATAFGHPLEVGSEELVHFSADNLSLTLPRIWNDLLIADEFRWMLPFMVWGAWRLARSHRHPAIILGLWVGALTAFHVPYHYLKLRDLLAIFPVLALLVGIGVADMLRLIHNLDNQQRRGWLLAGLLGLIFITVNLRTRTTLYFTADSFVNFGYLKAEQRDSFDEIASVTSKNAIIGVSLNSGAVILYSERDVVRPYEWTIDEWLNFVEIAQQNNHEVYLLVEGVDIEPIYEATLENYTLEPVTELQMPYFHFAGGSVNQAVTLYYINQPTQE